MRLIYGDTETTGLSVKGGDRLCEIGFKEFVDYRPTGRVYHQYVNPGRDMPEGAFNVHGLSSEFLKPFPTFEKVAKAMLDFVDGAELVFHNKEFDIGFLEFQLGLVRRRPTWKAVVDTLAVANKRFPGQPNSLDALASRFKVTGFDRSKHGTMVDIDILAEVHAHLSGKRTLALEMPTREGEAFAGPAARRQGAPRSGGAFAATDEQRAAHRAYMLERLPNGAWAGIYGAEEALAAETTGPAT